MQEINITGATGTGPYDIYICDLTLTFCDLVSSNETLPYSFLTYGIYENATSVIIKLIDSLGCEIFHPYSCPVTPTPTPTNTPTPTPTSTPGCHCISFENLSTGLTETDSWIIGDSGLGLPSSTYVNLYTDDLSLNNIFDISYTSFTNTDQSSFFNDILTYLSVPKNVYVTFKELGNPQNSSLIQITIGADLGGFYRFSGTVISGDGTVTYGNQIKLRFFVDGFSGDSLSFQFTECNGNIFYGSIPPLNILYYCGSNPLANKEDVVISVGNNCIGGITCPPFENIGFCLEFRLVISLDIYTLLFNIHFIPNGLVNNRPSWISDYLDNFTPFSSSTITWNPITFRWELNGLMTTIYSNNTSIPPLTQWYLNGFDPNTYVIVGYEGDCVSFPSPTPSPTQTPTPSPTHTPTPTPTPSPEPTPCWYTGFSLTTYTDIINGDSVSYFFQNNGTLVNGEPSFSSLPPFYNIFYSGGSWVLTSFLVGGVIVELGTTTPLLSVTGNNESLDVYCGNFSEPICLTLYTTGGTFYLPTILTTVTGQTRYEIYGNNNDYNWLFYSGSSWVKLSNSGTNVIVALTGLTSGDKPVGTWQIYNYQGVTGVTSSLGECDENLFSCTCFSVSAITNSYVQYLDCNRDLQYDYISGGTSNEYCVIRQLQYDVDPYSYYITTISGSTTGTTCVTSCP